MRQHWQNLQKARQRTPALFESTMVLDSRLALTMSSSVTSSDTAGLSLPGANCAAPLVGLVTLGAN
jgi:hypothetical protein